MINKCCLVFPNQLFKDSNLISTNNHIFLVEEYLFFKQYKFHKQKILLHLMSTQTFNSELNRRGIDSTLVTFDQLDGRDYLLNFFKYNLISEIYSKIENKKHYSGKKFFKKFQVIIFINMNIHI